MDQSIMVQQIFAAFLTQNARFKEFSRSMDLNFGLTYIDMTSSGDLLVFVTPRLFFHFERWVSQK